MLKLVADVAQIQGHPIVRKCLRQLFDKEKIFGVELRREMIIGPFPEILNKVAMLSCLTHKHGIVQIKVRSVHIEKQLHCNRQLCDWKLNACQVQHYIE